MYDKHDSIGQMISILYRMGQTNMGKRLKPYNIGKGQFVFLAALLVKDGISQDEIAANFNFDKATAARAVQHFEKHGYVQRIQSVEDARVKTAKSSRNRQTRSPEKDQFPSPELKTQGLFYRFIMKISRWCHRPHLPE